MIKPVTNFNPNNSKTNYYQMLLNEPLFRGSPLKISKSLYSKEDLMSKLGNIIKRGFDELFGPISSSFRKFTGDNSKLPFVEKPLTANGEIIHFGPDGTPIKIHVPDSEIKNPGSDGANIYRLDNSPNNDKIAKEAEALIKKEVGNITPEAEREIDPSKIIFGPDGMPIIDVDGRPIAEISDDVTRVDINLDGHGINSEHKTNFDSHNIENGTEHHNIDIDDIDDLD